MQTSRKTHPFVSQSINNFSDYDITKRGLGVSLSVPSCYLVLTHILVLTLIVTPFINLTITR